MASEASRLRGCPRTRGLDRTNCTKHTEILQGCFTFAGASAGAGPVDWTSLRGGQLKTVTRISTRTMLANSAANALGMKYSMFEDLSAMMFDLPISLSASSSDSFFHSLSKGQNEVTSPGLSGWKSSFGAISLRIANFALFSFLKSRI